MAACANTHSTKTQGAGLCCSAVTSGALAKTIGSTAMVTTAGGHCGHCSVVASNSKKHPGRAVLRFRMGGPGCPTKGSGCCALLS